jgi:hypothetical protein
MSNEELPGDGVMYVRLFTAADLADDRMMQELFDASPDGQAASARRKALTDSFSRGTIEISGEWDVP